MLLFQDQVMQKILLQICIIILHLIAVLVDVKTLNFEEIVKQLMLNDSDLCCIITQRNSSTGI